MEIKGSDGIAMSKVGSNLLIDDVDGVIREETSLMQEESVRYGFNPNIH